MTSMKRRPWKRLSTLRAARRRGTELPPPPPAAEAEPTPPLEPPDDDREFLPDGMWFVVPKAEAA
jgi:hypothetical protein